MEDAEEPQDMSYATPRTRRSYGDDKDGGGRCTTHQKRLKFFCSKHQLLLCSICAVKRHRGGCDEVLTLQEAVDDKKCEGKKILKIYNERIGAIENAITERRASKKLLDNNVQEIESGIHDVVKRLIDLVKSEERSLVKTLKNMQTHETDVLDKDITGLESSCSAVRDAHKALDFSLKGRDIDLIHAVIKEQQLLKENTENDTFVKKKFKDVDLKFTVSSQVQSFMKQFTMLGRVTMSDGEVTKDVATQRISPSSDVVRVSMAKDRNNARAVSSASDLKDESLMKVRTKWARERQLQRAGDKSTTYHVFPVSSSPPQHDLTETRQNASKLQNSYHNRSNSDSDSSGRQDSVGVQGRENGLTRSSPSEAGRRTPLRDKDINTFTPKYKFVKSPEVEFQDRKSPVCIRQQPEVDGPNNETIHVIARRVSPGPREELSINERSRARARSPNPIRGAHYTTVAIKEGEAEFGRSFAAVQLAEPRPPSPVENKRENVPVPQTSHPVPRMGVPATANSRSPSRDSNTKVNGAMAAVAEQPMTGSPVIKRKLFTIMGAGNRTKSLENLHLSLSLPDSPPMTDGVKCRRWIHKMAFASHGYGTKRQISGVGMLSDGRLIAIDQENCSVQLYDEKFEFVCESVLESRPFDIAVLSDSKIVVSLQTERVLKFFLVTHDSLTPVADLGVPCDLVCYGVCRGGGQYSVCCGDEVWVLSDQGRIVNRIRNDTDGHGLFSRAEYVAFDRSGEIMYVSDGECNKVLAVQVSDGRRLWEFSRQGLEPAGLKFVEQYLYVADRGQHRILMLNMDGHIVRQSVVGRLENPCSLCFNQAADNMVVSQMKHDTVSPPVRPIHVYYLG